MRCSLCESKLLVASSSKTSEASDFNIARAIRILCRYPPERLLPMSPTSVSYPCVNDMMVSWMLHALHTDFSSSIEASCFAKRRLFAIVSLNRIPF